ncbi:hypothetical protein COT97_03845 [Candidatus Falkowbacteria bacterium CG10_big_fil_rev_8_21_14_0_10_39_11]|uniref:Uncharacterized protein n=1 Tax=Candidatus Falkowbacteria bacterium CG10_big_fil_rev_8_21_14_0_10_39_11 TaxID=1974565 RepID=A0A2H0V6D2_9BACT|nr:MAG: hypothetical protein COT97_03845 [Candidatus Falkowbacteria bacterium CG10_big_fil_rev_8_21_14_0_10_39_11]
MGFENVPPAATPAENGVEKREGKKMKQRIPVAEEASLKLFDMIRAVKGASESVVEVYTHSEEQRKLSDRVKAFAEAVGELMAMAGIDHLFEQPTEADLSKRITVSYRSPEKNSTKTDGVYELTSINEFIDQFLEDFLGVLDIPPHMKSRFEGLKKESRGPLSDLVIDLISRKDYFGDEREEDLVKQFVKEFEDKVEANEEATEHAIEHYESTRRMIEGFMSGVEGGKFKDLEQQDPETYMRMLDSIYSAVFGSKQASKSTKELFLNEVYDREFRQSTQDN